MFSGYGYPAGRSSTVRYNILMKEETFVGLLHATREQLRDEPTREVEPRKVAMLAGIDPTVCNTPKPWATCWITVT